MLPGIGGWIVTIGLIFLRLLNHSGLVLLRREMRGLCIRREVCRFVPCRLCFFSYAGNRVELDLVWLASDTFNGLMALPNLIALLLMAKVIVNETRDFKQKIKNGELPH